VEEKRRRGARSREAKINPVREVKSGAWGAIRGKSELSFLRRENTVSGEGRTEVSEFEREVAWM